MEECDYTVIDCIRGCGLSYQRKNETRHFNNECLRNESMCEFCKANISKADEEEHLNKCPKFMVPCPENCGVTEIKRESVQDHLENECSKHEISCPFVDSNCTFKSLRGDMPKHLKESPGIHLNLMCKTISLQKKQLQMLSELVDRQKAIVDSVSTKVASVEKFYGSQLIWKIDKFAVI
jgi:hypothetical protein